MRSLTSAYGTKLPNLVGQSMSALPGYFSDINLFRYRQSIVHFDAEVSNRASH